MLNLDVSVKVKPSEQETHFTPLACPSSGVIARVERNDSVGGRSCLSIPGALLAGTLAELTGARTVFALCALLTLTPFVPFFLWVTDRKLADLPLDNQ